jgi:integrase
MRGECVRLYRGKRGDVLRIRYQDASGALVNETLGAVADGWTRKRALAALEERRTDVRRDHLVKPAAETFAQVAEHWLATIPEIKNHRRTTRADYAAMVRNHLLPHFDKRNVAAITSADIDAYVVAKRSGKPPLAARTLNLHISRLHAIFELARKEGLIRVNPVADATRPKVPKSRWTILSPVEVMSVLKGFDAMIVDASDETERAWSETAKAMVVTMVFAWLRRGELLGLRWRDVELAHPNGPRLHVRQTLVRGHESQPKTDDGSRSIALATPVAEELFRHLQRSHYASPDDFVFCHPTKGTPVPSGYFKPLVVEALRRAGVERSMREYHDWRHTGITNAAASGMPPIEIMAMAGHADFKTTERYIDLAGVVFSSSVELLSSRFGTMVPNSGSKVPVEDTGIGSQTGSEAEAA